jgi:hypothetical protein
MNDTTRRGGWAGWRDRGQEILPLLVLAAVLLGVPGAAVAARLLGG